MDGRMLRFGDPRGQRFDAKHKIHRVACELSAATEIRRRREAEEGGH